MLCSRLFLFYFVAALTRLLQCCYDRPLDLEDGVEFEVGQVVRDWKPRVVEQTCPTSNGHFENQAAQPR